MKLRGCKRGHIVSEEVIKWIIYLAIIVAAGFAINGIISRAAG